MALQLGATRAAFIAAGAPEDKASAAAEELAGYQSEFTRLRDDMRDGFSKVDREFAKVRGDINLLRWMTGANLAVTLAVFIRLFVR